MSEQIPDAQIKAVDRLYWSPSERATGVHNLIEEVRSMLAKKGEETPTDLDLLCYAIEYASKQAIAIGDERFLAIMVAASNWLYSIHYSNPGRLYGEPEHPARGESPDGPSPSPPHTGEEEQHERREEAGDDGEPPGEAEAGEGVR